MCDIDNDGLLDVVAGGPKDDVTIFRNASPHPGTGVFLFPRMDKPNGCACRAGGGGVAGPAAWRPRARPLVREKAHSDATPIHIGLGADTMFDLRVTFPGGRAQGGGAQGRSGQAPAGRDAWRQVRAAASRRREELKNCHRGTEDTEDSNLRYSSGVQFRSY